MKKMIPVYILLTAILTVGILLLRKAEAITSELAGVRSEQFKQPKPGRPSPREATIPVYVVNDITISR